MASIKFREILNKSVAPMIVGKIDNNLIPEDIEGWEPILLDCFLINEETAERLVTEYKGELRIPSYGSKFIGAYRDKGSITGVLKRYVPVCDFELSNEEEVQNFCTMLQALRKDFEVIGTTVRFELDIIAECSYGRDNVTALMLQSIFDFEANIKGEDIYLSYQEIDELEGKQIIKERGFNMQVRILDKETGKFVHDFGKVAILLEDYFWQPSHDNDTCEGTKNVAFTYNQALDAIAVLSPTLHGCIMKSIDKSKIKESMLCTGIHLQSIDEKEILNNTIAKSSNILDNSDDDELI